MKQTLVTIAANEDDGLQDSLVPLADEPEVIQQAVRAWRVLGYAYETVKLTLAGFEGLSISAAASS